MPRIQINIIGTVQSRNATWAVTTQWAVSALPSASSMATALAAMRTALVASAPFRAGVSSNYSVVSLKALGYPTPVGNALWTIDAGGTAVAGTAPALTVPLATVVSEQTGAAGPSYRGRSYWPSSGDSQPSSNGALTTAQQIPVRTSWIAMHNVLSAGLATLGGSPVHVVFSRKLGAMTPITVIRTGNRIDTSRGRFGDDLEVYVSQAVPDTIAFSAAPEGDDVSPSVLNLPPDATPDQISEQLKLILANAHPSDLKLGPFEELIDALTAGLVAREVVPD